MYRASRDPKNAKVVSEIVRRHETEPIVVNTWK